MLTRVFVCLGPEVFSIGVDSPREVILWLKVILYDSLG